MKLETFLQRFSNLSISPERVYEKALTVDELEEAAKLYLAAKENLEDKLEEVGFRWG